MTLTSWLKYDLEFKNFLNLKIYVNITDRQTYKKYNSELHNKKINNLKKTLKALSENWYMGWILHKSFMIK